MVQVLPLSLFATGDPQLANDSTILRHDLDHASWIDTATGWLHGGDALLDALVRDLPWRQSRRLMWNRWVDEPRLTTGVRLADASPVLRAIARSLGQTYASPFASCWCNYYRDGRDSVAWHSDQVAKERRNPIVAIVSLGGPRTLALRPKGGGAAQSFAMHSGDLLVMGGATQHHWEHAVAKCVRAAPRLSVTFRHG